MPTVFITGANRGLGLEFCRQYAADGWQVIATCRQPATASELQQLAKQYPAIQCYALEVADFAQIDQLAQQLRGVCVDVLISNAGVYGDTQDDGFGQLDYDVWAQTLRINSMAPVKLAEAFLSNLSLSTQAKLVAITSLMGSMSDNRSGGSILYRSSKAALNAAMKSLSLDLHSKNIAVLLLHPGWVKTRMGGDDAPIQPVESIHGMRQVIQKLKLENTGQFINFRGQPLPW